MSPVKPPPVSAGRKAWRFVLALLMLAACWAAVVGVAAFLIGAVTAAARIVEWAL